MKKYVGWQNYAISGVLTFGVLIGIFQLKLALGYSISISASTLCIGSIVAIIISVIFLITKKPAILFVLSAIALVTWVIIKGDLFVSAAILAGGSVGLIVSIPFSAGVLSRISKPTQGSVS